MKQITATIFLTLAVIASVSAQKGGRQNILSQIWPNYAPFFDEKSRQIPYLNFNAKNGQSFERKPF